MKKNGTIFFLAAALFLLSCNKGVAPNGNGTVKKTPRDYAWTKTTIGDGSYQTGLFSIWGSSPRDVYVVGHGALFTGKIWRFNESAWSDITTKYIESYNAAFPGKNIYNWTPNGVWGFGPSDVWIVGSRDTSEVSRQIKEGFVMRFNGQVWREVPIPGAYKLLGIWGTNPTDVWACGSQGRFYHFNGTTWSNYSVADTIFVNFFAGELNSKVYASGANLGLDGRSYSSLCEWDGTGWKVLEVSVNIPSPTFQVVSIVQGTLYSVTPQTVRKRLSTGTWPVLFSDPAAVFSWTKGLSETNLFVTGGGETLLHFNGQEWKRLTQWSDPNVYYSNLFMFDSEVFILGNTGGLVSYIVHGK